MTGLITRTPAANAKADGQTETAPARSNPAPRAKKNITRKKSRNGRRLSAIKGAMGLLASVIPPMKAPTS